MNITKEPNGELLSVIHINIQEEDYKDQVNNTLKSYRKKANMPGFRPGMVPMGMIKKMYGASVMAEEVNKLVSEALDKYIAENKLDLLGHPLANMEKTKQINFDTDKEFDFYFDIAVTPDIEVDLKSIGKVPYYKIKATDKEIDVAVKDVLDRYGEEVQPDEVGENDLVTGKAVQVDENGNPVEGGYETEVLFYVTDLKLKKYQKEITGKKVGDSIIINAKKAFAEDKVKVIMGEQITDEQINSDYKIEITNIKRHIPAELNEELFKKVYPDADIKTEEDLRNRLKEDMEKEYTKESDRKLVDDVVDKITESIDFELPEEFLKRWVLESNQGAITKEQLETQWESYVKSLKWQVIESKLAKQYGDLDVSNEDVRNQVRNYFGIKDRQSSNDQIEQIVDQVLSNGQEQNRIFNNLKTEKLAKVFSENVEKEIKEVTVDEFLDIINPKMKEEEEKEEKENSGSEEKEPEKEQA